MAALIPPSDASSFRASQQDLWRSTDDSLFVIGDCRELLACNEAGLRTLAAADLVLQIAGRIRFIHGNTNVAIDKYISENHREPTVLVCRNVRSKKAILLRIEPRHWIDEITPSSRQGYQLRVGPLFVSRRLDANAIRTAFQLTDSEAAVAASISEGYSVDAIAQLRRVSAHTVRSQLLAATAKLGISRQADMVRLIVGNPFFWR